MKIGLVRYSTPEETPKQNKLITGLRAYYIENIRPYLITQMELDGVPLLEARIQATYNQAENKSVVWQKKIEDALKELCDLEAAVVIPPSRGAFPTQLLRVMHGRDIAGLFIMDAIKKVAEENLKNFKVTIIDGKNRYTKLAIDMICPSVNYLSIFTDRKEDFLNQAEEIYEDCGLNLQLFSNAKGSIMSDADIIINCGYDMENYDYTFKKGAYYFDLVQNLPKYRRLKLRREDMQFANSIIFKRNGDFFSAKEAEAIYYVKNDIFRGYVCGRYDTWIATQAENALKHEGITLEGFSG